MFRNLIASNPQTQRSTLGTIASVSTHVLLGVIAVVGTMQAREEIARVQLERPVNWVKVEKTEPLQPKSVALPVVPKTFRVLTAPIEIPTVLPEINPTIPITNEEEFKYNGGLASGRITITLGPDRAWPADAVEKTASLISNTARLRYPDMLRSASVEGEVLVQFVVDTTGRVEVGSFRVVQSTHDQFTNSVRSAISNMRFRPAEIGGVRVRQLVQQPFAFTLSKK